jgi:Fe-S cluster assembly iron-binding protein IscA
LLVFAFSELIGILHDHLSRHIPEWPLQRIPGGIVRLFQTRPAARFNFNQQRQEAILQSKSPVIKLNKEAASALRSLFAEKGLQKPIRIDLCFQGCCDPTLELRLDNAARHDLCLDLEGLQFIISPATYELAGDVTIAHVDEKSRQGFIVTSSKPMSEWDGFGVCNVKI